MPVYANTFGIVEVNTSTYAIPRPQQVQSWVDRVPAGFRFHFKAFGLFCSRSIGYSALPYELKAITADPGGHGNVSLADLGDERVQQIWDIFHAAIAPAKAAAKLGVVVFQFHLNFTPGETNRQHVLWCREKLAGDVPMAVEFRNRAWFESPAAAAETASFLRAHGIILIAADELKHETFQPDKYQTGLPPGMKRETLPIALEATHRSLFYVSLS